MPSRSHLKADMLEYKRFGSGTTELIVQLLSAVDRSSAKGKRDYAILLLACRLGLRAGDIRTLKLDNLHWAESTIEITQAKTGAPLTLPLTNEVGEALIDYLKSGRPQTKYREVFLKVNPPFDPFTGNNLYHIVTYWRLLSGITFQSSQQSSTGRTGAVRVRFGTV